MKLHLPLPIVFQEKSMLAEAAHGWNKIPKLEERLLRIIICCCNEDSKQSFNA